MMNEERKKLETVKKLQRVFESNAKSMTIGSQEGMSDMSKEFNRFSCSQVDGEWNGFVKRVNVV